MFFTQEGGNLRYLTEMRRTCSPAYTEGSAMPKGHLLRRLFIVFVYTFSKTAQPNKNIGLRTFALTGRWVDGMALISQGAAPLALGYGQALGLQPAVIINDNDSKKQ